MKKSFTLLELLISITLFMIIIIFLYKTLDQTKYSNNLFSKKENILKEFNHLHNIFLEDIAESIDKIEVSFDKEKNAIVKFKTNNTYHNSNFNNVTYLVGANKKLLRVESQTSFNEQEISNDMFQKNFFIDVILENIEYFELANNGNNYNFIIKEKNKDRLIFNCYSIKE